MLGTDAEPGIYLQTLTDLFRAIEDTRDNMDYRVSMSYLEVSLPLAPGPLSGRAAPGCPRALARLASAQPGLRGPVAPWHRAPWP